MHGGALFFCRRCGEVQLPQQAAELQLLEKVDEGGLVETARGVHGFQIQVDRAVDADGDQLLGEARLVGVLDEIFAEFLLREIRGAVEDGFETAALLDQPGGGFGADAGHAGHVVGAVAHQSQDVDDLVGLDAEFGDHCLDADGFVVVGGAARVEQLDAGAHQLHEVLVS